ncbi:hypothetical protein V5O48_018753 [Marasmius crinis-equi]|uniref:Uncharacterized protein n=1 Tax=Marasmius crinis-equi TaxID=585013 RepID=A0ABR3EKD6_9AGAR
MAQYPLAHAAGLTGSKAEMRKQNNHLVREELQRLSPCPPRSRWFKVDCLGHPVMSPQMRTQDPAKAGSWFQLCRKPKSFGCQMPMELKAPLGIHHASLPPFDKLYAVRDELQETTHARKSTLEEVRDEVHDDSPAPSSPIDLSLRSSPGAALIGSSPRPAPVASSPASSVINLTLDDEEKDYVGLGFRRLKIWVKGKDPVVVELPAINGKVRLAGQKWKLGEAGVEKKPMEWYDMSSKKWRSFLWSDQLGGNGDALIKLREAGLEIFGAKMW